jgi:hypothetical protein
MGGVVNAKAKKGLMKIKYLTEGFPLYTPFKTRKTLPVVVSSGKKAKLDTKKTIKNQQNFIKPYGL